MDFLAIDLIGPWHIATSSVRAQSAKTCTRSFTRNPLLLSSKMYLLSFVCLKSRCINLELCDMMDNSSVARCLQNHCARHGCPEEVFSDLGSQFVSLGKHSVDNEEDQVYKELGMHLKRYAEKQGIHWNFNSSSRHPEASGAIEVLNKEIKKLIDQVYPYEFKITALEFVNLSQRVTSIYHSIPVLASDSEPGRHFSRADLLHGPHRAQFLAFNSPESGRNCVGSCHIQGNGRA